MMWAQAAKKPDPAQAQQAAQHPDHAQELRQAGVTEPGHQAAVHAAVARGVRLDVILDAVRRFGPSVLDLVEQIVHAFGGAQGEPAAARK